LLEHALSRVAYRHPWPPLAMPSAAAAAALAFRQDTKRPPQHPAAGGDAQQSHIDERGHVRRVELRGGAAAELARSPAAAEELAGDGTGHAADQGDPDTR